MDDQFDCDYIVVGSGAGGGTVAARLAEAGMKVIVLEAGGDPRTDLCDDRFPCDYDIPSFHPFATENPAMQWDFFVDHFEDEEQAKRDEKRVPSKGVWYPRAGTLGGCTAHNAMIFITAQPCDWDTIADEVGDQSWNNDAMQKYQHRVESCRHRKIWKWLSNLGVRTTGHGWSGWLSVEVGKPLEALKDNRLRRSLELAGISAAKGIGSLRAALDRLINGALDPNDVRQNGREGLCYAPLATDRHCRVGARDRLLAVGKKHPEHLQIRLRVLASKIMFEGNRAVGVEYLEGKHLYRADPKASGGKGEKRIVRARREVILAGGAFNTPQLLMLSGIGPREHLQQHKVELRKHLPGVGTNLQDRYEVCVQYELKEPWDALKEAKYEPDDPIGKQWDEKRAGIYISNGAALAFKRKSDPKLNEADLFIFALLGCFKGYFPGYSKALIDNPRVLSWAILKARTDNRAGTVRLRTNDPTDTPNIQFHYFEEGTNKASGDLSAVAKGVEFVRGATNPLIKLGLVEGELAPSVGRTGKELESFVRDNAWGHHASCTCPMGAEAAGAVLNSRLQVHGFEQLRVVDASIFPRIPGYFIVSAVYMAAEKAADMILADVREVAQKEREPA